jgi:hypothetical protein
MSDLFIENGNSTPAVFFNVNNGILTFAGKSLPENATGFYKPIEEALDVFIIEHSNKLLLITCEFEYINTSSSKALFNILKKAIAGLGNNVSIIWGYEEDDEDMKEQGETFSEAIGVEFEYRQFSAE